MTKDVWHAAKPLLSSSAVPGRLSLILSESCDQETSPVTLSKPNGGNLDEQSSGQHSLRRTQLEKGEHV